MSPFKDVEGTYIYVFNVGRGLSIFIRTSNNLGFHYDLGCSKDFSPTDFVEENLMPHIDSYRGTNGKSHKLAQMILSHPHADHTFEIHEMRNTESSYYNPALFTCPHDKITTPAEAINFKRVENPDQFESLVDDYRSLYKGRNMPLQTIKYEGSETFDDLKYGVYYVRPPLIDKSIHEKNDLEYANATSLMLYLEYKGNNVLLTGDVTPDVFDYLFEDGECEKRYTKFSKMFHLINPKWHKETADQPELTDLLREKGLTVLLAPHHGLESCFPSAVYDNMKDGKPDLVVISDKRRKNPTDGNTHQRYGSKEGAFGMNVDIEGNIDFRRSVSTKNNRHILVKFSSNQNVNVFARKQPTELLGL